VSGPKFSVVVPAFNAAVTIRSCLLSILRQTEPDLELIVIDDGSTDTTPSIVRELAADDRRLQIWSQPNRGVSAALNRGLDEATGVYLSILGSDDVWLPTYLQTLGGVLDARPEAAFAYSQAWWVAATPRPRVYRRDVMSENMPDDGPPSTPDALLEQLLVRGNFIPASVTLRHDLIETVGKFDERLRVGEDYELWLRFASHGYAAAHIDKPLWIKRLREDALSWDARATTQAWRDISEIIVSEYDLPERLRRVAESRIEQCDRKLQELSEQRRPSAVRRLRAYAGRVKRRLFWWRSFYVRPPREVRESFFNLTAAERASGAR
jgi:glycosyltransferase involved in cell wall biosynthesis